MERETMNLHPAFGRKYETSAMNTSVSTFLVFQTQQSPTRPQKHLIS